MTRPQLELLAEMREAAQSIARTQRDWEGSLLERRLADLESALRAQAQADAREITWDAAVARLMQGGNLILTARAADQWELARVLRDSAEKIEEGVREHHDESCQEGLWFRLALTRADTAGEGC